jgi:hypothetical protein
LKYLKKEKKGLSHFANPPRTKALLIFTNMLAAVRLIRLTNRKDFEEIKQIILKDLTDNNK